MLIPFTSSPISSSDLTDIRAVRSPSFFDISPIISSNCLLADLSGRIVTIIIIVISTPSTHIIASITTNAITEILYWLLSSSDASLT